jgi:dihydrodipicolinate synthase/N-acetylneuraminate lyase
MNAPASEINPASLIVPRRKISGFSAILLPVDARERKGGVQWEEFDAHVARTARAGLTPAVNMDTGYINLIDDETKIAVLARTAALMGGSRFLAGAFIGDRPGDAWNPSAYQREIDLILRHGGTPVIFQSHGLVDQDSSGIIAAYQQIARFCDEFVAFELGTMFAPFGAIFDLPTYKALLRIPQCIGAKHSSLDRTLEWQRLQARNAARPDFMVLTGNDLAIDMVMYGSDYLLGLSSFAPDLFGLRDRLWEQGDLDFHALNDLLQYLGHLAFRNPVPAYKHSAAQTLKLQGWIASDEPWPGCARRPDSDREILRDIVERMNLWRKRHGL